MNLNEIFKAIAVNMLTEFEHTQTQIKHMGERGNEREAVLKSFLSKYLPTRYGVSSGEIIDTDGGTSHQCDLIIYDHFNSPLLLAGENIRIFPAESVFAVIEVKSVLSAQEIDDCVTKIKHLKNLKRENGPIPGVIFAFKSGWKKASIQRTATEFQKQYRQCEGHQYVDLICILSHGIIVLDTVLDGFSSLKNDISKRCMLTYFELNISVLLYFFNHLLLLLDTYSYAKSQFFQYSKGVGMLGFAKKRSILEE